MADRHCSDILLSRWRTTAGGAALLVLPVGVVTARTSEQVVEAASSEGFDITSAASLILGAIFLGIVVMVVLFIRRRLEEQRTREAMADAAFEMEVLSSYRASDDNQFLVGQSPYTVEEVASPAAVAVAAAAVNPDPSVQAQMQAPQMQPQMQAPQVQPAGEPAPAAFGGYLAASDDQQKERADVVAASVLSQLRHAGMLNDTDGYMELNGNAQGAVVLRLKDGRRALLVPYHETEAFTRRNLRRFDLLIFVGRDGKAVVVNSLENVIAERVASRF